MAQTTAIGTCHSFEAKTTVFQFFTVYCCKRFLQLPRK